MCLTIAYFSLHFAPAAFWQHSAESLGLSFDLAG